MKLSKEELRPLLDEAYQRHGINQNLLYSVIMTESGGDPYAIRYEPHFKYNLNVKIHARANNISEETELVLQMSSIGLCQCMGLIARELGFRQNLLQLTVPQISVNLGAKKLKLLSQKYNTIDDVLASYNAGSPRKLENGLYVNQSYVDKVRSFMNKKEF